MAHIFRCAARDRNDGLTGVCMKDVKFDCCPTGSVSVELKEDDMVLIWWRGFVVRVFYTASPAKERLE